MWFRKKLMGRGLVADGIISWTPEYEKRMDEALKRKKETAQLQYEEDLRRLRPKNLIASGGSERSPLLLTAALKQILENQLIIMETAVTPGTQESTKFLIDQFDQYYIIT